MPHPHGQLLADKHGVRKTLLNVPAARRMMANAGIGVEQRGAKQAKASDDDISEKRARTDHQGCEEMDISETRTRVTRFTDTPSRRSAVVFSRAPERRSTVTAGRKREPIALVASTSLRKRVGERNHRCRSESPDAERYSRSKSLQVAAIPSSKAAASLRLTAVIPTSKAALAQKRGLTPAYREPAGCCLSSGSTAVPSSKAACVIPSSKAALTERARNIDVEDNVSTTVPPAQPRPPCTHNPGNGKMLRRATSHTRTGIASDSPIVCGAGSKAIECHIRVTRDQTSVLQRALARKRRAAEAGKSGSITVTERIGMAADTPVSRGVLCRGVECAVSATEASGESVRAEMDPVVDDDALSIELDAVESDCGKYVLELDAAESDPGEDVLELHAAESDCGEDVLELDAAESDPGEDVLELDVVESDPGEDDLELDAVESDTGVDFLEMDVDEEGALDELSIDMDAE